MAALLLMPFAALAQYAVTTTQLTLRAGPADDYPAVAVLAPGTSVTIQGCVDGYSWCDSVVGDMRGWLYGQYLTAPYQGQPVPVYAYGAAIGFPIIAFSFDSYWDRWYRDRRWYGDRYRWEHHPPPPRPGHTGYPGYRSPPARPGPPSHHAAPWRPGNYSNHAPSGRGESGAHPQGPSSHGEHRGGEGRSSPGGPGGSHGGPSHGESSHGEPSHGGPSHGGGGHGDSQSRGGEHGGGGGGHGDGHER